MSIDHSIDLDEKDLPASPRARRLFERSAEAVPDGLRARAAEICLLLASGEEIEAGVQIGGLEVVRVLGRGGQATVYLAQRENGARLALKIPRLDVAARLVKEAQILRSLEHPRIVRIEEASLEGPLPYLAMEFLEGGTLADLLAEKGALPLESVRSIGAAVLEALRFAHERGVVHRDLKPANILFDAQGHVRVADFGIGLIGTAEKGEGPLANSLARSLATAGTLFAGTPAYMAPEQEDASRAENGKVDGRADLFALGKLLFEALTGRSPRTVRPVSRERKEVSPEWDVFIFKLVEERPHDRFSSAQAAADALNRLPSARTSRWPSGVAITLIGVSGYLIAHLVSVEIRSASLTPDQLNLILTAFVMFGVAVGGVFFARWLADRPRRGAIATGPISDVQARARAVAEVGAPAVVLDSSGDDAFVAPQEYEVLGPTGRAEWVGDMRHLAKIRHPNLLRIVRVIDDEENTRAIVEHFDGQPLADGLTDPLTPAAAAAVGLQLSDGITAFHASGMVLASLTPRDVLISSRLEAKIRVLPRPKFGSSVAIQHARREIDVTYMSPEQVMGGDVDRRSDVYSLGAVLHRCLTGRPPFEHEDGIELCRLIRKTTPRPPRALRPEIPAPLEAIILRALEKDPDARPSAAELANVLRPYVTDLGAAPNALVGQRVRGYYVTEYASRDATGCHFRAKHEESGRIVALTLIETGLREALGDEFLGGIEGAKRIDDPRIQRVLDAFEGAFLVAERHHSPALDHRPTPSEFREPEAAARIIAPVCDALETLRTAGRSVMALPPHAIRAVEEDEVVLEGWLLRGRAAVDTLRNDLRELPYISPGHALGGVHSVGVILFELLTGRLPFSTEEARSIASGARRRHPRAREIPAALDAIIAKALEVDPANRFSSPGEMARELRAQVESGKLS